ncbi:SIR2 family protein [Halarcobacter bivalviorum]|uniref:SIR2-like domain-containing protein n=3 Tax=Arcobacteraceae TaxID=2808963 RepID=A0AB33GF88_9BACT|nr:SIR2 family protein [Halarcobacter bivalviorum]AXH12573.1 hypothetical protein ABIV_1582 [Halarcobacter bivalviorum]
MYNSKSTMFNSKLFLNFFNDKTDFLDSFFNKNLYYKIAHYSQQDKIDEVKNWYKSERLVFVLGAGTSIDYGLPSWDELLQKLFLLTIKSDNDSQKDNKSSVLARTFNSVFEPSSLISARYLHSYFKKNNPNSTVAFEKSIRDVLYENIDKNLKDSDLLKEIRQFCIAAGRSPNLDSIITYNYDDIIEECLRNIDVDIPFTPIHARGMNYKKNQLPIYHVHGYLPRQGKLTSKNKVVLSENGYHQQYTDTYGWSNLIQINKFKDYNCLFIGVSFSDPNLRRLLDIAKNERGDDEIHHFCLKKRYDKKKVKKELEKLLSEDPRLLDEKQRANIELDDVVNDLIKLMQKFEENDAISFGVGLIWVDDYNEIPLILKNIRE